MEAGLLEHAFHELQMVVDQVLLETGPTVETAVAFLHPLLLLVQHEVGPPAGLLLKTHFLLLEGREERRGLLVPPGEGGMLL